MGDSSPPSPGLCLCQEFKQDPVPRAKRLSDSAVQVQALQSAKKACVLSHGCSTPDPAGNPLFPSPGSGCSLFLDESGHDDLAARFSVSKYNDVAISLDISRCFDDSELDDSLLELSGSEKGNSPFDYTEEEIQEILADDSTDAEQQHLAGESHLSPNVSGGSDKAESSSCTAGTSVSEAASEVTEEPKEPQEHPSGSSGCGPGFLSGSAALDGAQLQQELDLDLQELLSLSPFAAACSDEALEDNYPGEVETLEAMIDDCLNSTAAGSCIPKESSEGVKPKGQQSLAQDCSGRCVPSSNLPWGQSTGDESPASVLLSNKELPKATTSCSSRKSGSPEDAEGESTGAEQPSGSTKLSDTAVSQTGQEETTTGKKSGKVIPVPQGEEERPKQRTCISEVQPEQKKRFSLGCANSSEEKCGYYLRGGDLSFLVMEEYVQAKDPLETPLGLAWLKPAHLQDCQVLLNQMKEITGIQDSAFLLAALKAADGDLMEAVTFLTEDPAPEPVQDPAAAEPSAWEGSAVGKQLPQDVSAAPAPHNQDNLCTANTVRPLELPKAPAAERDAAERPQDTHSAENKYRSKRKRCETLSLWVESPKQNDWRRAGDWPVGMKNIGNTCWFSAVIQSLFQLPEFRRLVLGYSLPQNVLESCRHTGKRNIAFMQELQCLFALMLGTWRKFVDPSAALELLRDVFRSAEQPQQDVSEFTHKLLDWLEDAFQLTVNATSPGDKSENPMVQLFYGTFLTEGVHEGNTFSKIETFGQYPLQVNGYRNLNECLEGAMVEGEMDEATTSQSAKYGQERWFTKLPPVLTFELSRFKFNQSLGQPEKIHTKLEFPQTIYMDRYLYCNKDLIQMKREEMKRLKEKMVTLQQKLERYMEYGSGPARFPLPDMLQYVLEFIATKPAVAVSSAQSSQTTLLHSQAKPHVLDVLSQPNGIQERTDVRTEDEAFLVANSLLQQNSSMELQPPVSPAELSERPAPHVVSEEELKLVQTCLQRWRNEIEQDVQDLKESIARINLSVEQMYCDPLLQQVPYRLHAVLVHEGQANAGHYWAFIYDQPRKRWLKYNDIWVTESSWEELERESFGGLRNASAYCLMYISEQSSHVGADEDEGPEARQFQKEVEALSPELRRYIQEDNWRLEQEAEEWEEEQSCKIPQMEPSPTSELQDLSSESGPEQSSVCEQSVRSLSSEHARIAKEQTAKAIANTADAYEKNGVEAALCERKEVEPLKAHPGEASPTVQAEQPQDTQEAEAAAQTSSQVSEVEIPSVGKIPVRSDADGYNEEVMLSPAMQGVILAIAKARQTFDRDGSEAGLVKAFHEEYSRLYLLSKETPTPQNDARLQHVLIYFLQNNAPQQVVERTLLEQFADKNLSYDERSISIMKVARAKLSEIGPDDVDMEEYKRWHEDYSLFRKVSIYLLTGLELYQNRKYQESLTYLVYAYQSNTKLLLKGTNRGVSESLIALYRRKCLLKLNEVAASLFVSCEEAHVSEGVSILNELIIPCMHLMNNLEISKEDLDAIEVMRNRWCSYLGREDMDAKLQMKLGELLPRLLDGSTEVIVLKEPPKIRPNSPYDLCSRFAAVMESIHGASTVTVK